MEWNIVVHLRWKGESSSFDLTASEQGILNLLRSAYTGLEERFKDMAQSRPGDLPVGLIDDSLMLLRCLVFNRLQEHAGRYVVIRRVQASGGRK